MNENIIKVEDKENLQSELTDDKHIDEKEREIIHSSSHVEVSRILKSPVFLEAFKELLIKQAKQHCSDIVQNLSQKDEQKDFVI